MKSGVLLFALSVVTGNYAFANTPTWEKWEQDNSVEHNGSFLVIDQPNQPFCYIKQSYYNNTDLMELVRIKGKTRVTLPFLSGTVGKLFYWVDSGEKYSATPDGRGINLAENVFDEMKAGNILYVQVTPVGEAIRTQEFRLNGFTASIAALDNPKCND